jgi:hypothetical protein
MHRKSLSGDVEDWSAWISLISHFSCLPSFPSPWPFRHPSQPSPQLYFCPFISG